jgi:hypothetical protein
LKAVTLQRCNNVDDDDDKDVTAKVSRTFDTPPSPPFGGITKKMENEKVVRKEIFAPVCKWASPTGF